MTDSELRHIFVEIFNGRGNHGSFLRAFAETMLLADLNNWALLRPAARAIADKYQLLDYLDTFPSQSNERESQSSKHCDSGYMNDTRFGTDED